MKGKLKIILPVLLLVLVGAGGAYKFLLSGGGSAKKAAPPKVVGDAASPVAGLHDQPRRRPLRQGERGPR